MLPSFVPAAGTTALGTKTSSVCVSARTVRVNRPRQAATRMTIAPISQSTAFLNAYHAANTLLAGTIDIGPFTGLDLETVVFFGAIAGGVLVALLISFVIIRF